MPRASGALLECVPNVSEGRDAGVLARLAAAIGGVPGVTLMNVHADPDHHRSVFSFLGSAAAVRQAACALADAVVEAIDMRTHHGIHPRVGALDVVPFVPLAGTPMAEAVAAAHEVGRAIAERHALPVYYYGHAARRPTRRTLPALRAGQYEALAERLRTPDGQPDDGPARFDARTGAVLVGARDVLVAYNVWLDSADAALARAVARAVREATGGLPRVQALGVPLSSRGIAQVSMNLLDYRITSIAAAFDRVRAETERRGGRVLRAELVGLAPRAAFGGRSPESVGLPDFTPSLYLDAYLPAPTPTEPTS
jgi:glutamate formiminotransferase